IAVAFGGFLAAPFASLTGGSLAWCDALVSWADGLPGACWYAGNLPPWWLIGFYTVGIIWLVAPYLLEPRRGESPGGPSPVPVKSRVRWAAPTVLTSWACVGLLGGAVRATPDELRVTFLAVGHGNCTVLETPDGRCILYDSGSLAGPDVTRRQIAPFLWSRGVRRIDELILSHADLDHFNGLPALLERFAVGQITVTPSFADKTTPGVIHTL